MSTHDIDYIRCTLVYDPLDIDNRVEVELQYVPGMPLTRYIEGLPADVDWGIALNNREVPIEGALLVMPKPGDHLVVAPIPRGGGGDGKNILAVVASIALSAFAPWAGGAIAGALGFTGNALNIASAVFGAAVSVAGGLLINALLPPPDQDLGETQESFGIDGPKNTSAEGIPVPVIFGRHGFGGNMVDLYTENVTDTDGKPVQYLYGRVIVSEGPINRIIEDEIYINDQPLSSYDEVEIQTRLGLNDQSVSDWFSDTVSLYNQARDLTTDWQTYTTVSEVDKLRLDFTFPLGLYRVNREGEQKEFDVTIEAEYRKQGDTAWKPFFSTPVWGAAGPGDAHRVTFLYTPARDFDGDRENIRSGVPNFNLEYRVDGGAWQVYKTYSDDSLASGAEITETLDGFTNNAVTFRLVDLKTYTSPLDAPTFEITETKSRSLQAGVTISEKSPTPVRRTFKTQELSEGVYEVRYRRTEPEVGRERYFDKCILSDVGEIVTDKVGLVNTAWLGFKIRLTGQLNSIPRVEGVAEGVKMGIFDNNGIGIGWEYSRNPADIALAMQLNARWGGKLDDWSGIDWPAYAEWRDFCTLNNLTFDGIFSETSNLDDALKHVFLAGRAQRVRVGAKMSVAIDGPAEPDQMFNSSLIEKGSLEISYLPFADRANDVSISFYDASNRYKQTTVRAVNDAAIQAGEPLKTVSLTVKGMTDRARVQREANFRINYNKHVVRTANWVAPIRALTCSVGSVVLLQSEMVDWGVGGLLKAGSSSTNLKLDRPVPMEQGKSYAVIIHRDTRLLHQTTISAVIDTNIISVNAAVLNNGTAHRLVVGGNDVGITRVIPGASTTDLVLDRYSGVTYSAGQSVEIWSTDVIDQVDVVNGATGLQEVEELTLVAPLTDGAPPQFTAFMFGEKATLTRPFRITEINRKTETTAEISAVEYVEEIYDDIDINTGEQGVTGPVAQHVTDLTLSEISVYQKEGTRVSKVAATWRRAENGTHLSAAVFVKYDDGDFRLYDEVTQDRIEIDATVGQVVTVRVQTRTRDGLLGEVGAPVQSITVRGNVVAPEAPVGFATRNAPRAITFVQPDSTLVDREAPPYDLQLMVGDPTFGRYRLHVSDVGAGFENSTYVTEFLNAEFTYVTPLNVGQKDYYLQVIDIEGNVSNPSDPILAFPEAPRRVSLSVSDQSIEYSTTGDTPSPALVTVTATGFGVDTEVDVFYEFSVEGASVQNTTSNVYEYTPQANHANMPERIEVKLREGSSDGDVLASDVLTMVGLKPGGATIMFLSNEAHVILTENDGSNPNLTGASSTITIYSGVTDETSSWTLSKVDVGVTSTLVGNLLTITGISQDAGYVEITATKAGADPITKRMTITRLLRPLDGRNGIGQDGSNGDTVVVGRVYYQFLVSTSPGTPTATSFDPATGQFTGLTANWSTNQPTVDQTNTAVQEWRSEFTVTIDGDTGDQTIYFAPPVGAIQVASDIGSDGYNGSGDGVTKGTQGWYINRLTGYAEFGAAAIRDTLQVGQIPNLSIGKVTDLQQNLTNLEASANNANQTATRAEGKADQAIIAADDAHNAANAVGAVANDAYSLANTKNRSYTQPTQPTGSNFRPGDLWVDTFNGFNYFWDGSQWNRAAIVADGVVSTWMATQTLSATQITTDVMNVSRINFDDETIGNVNGALGVKNAGIDTARLAFLSAGDRGIATKTTETVASGQFQWIATASIVVPPATTGKALITVSLSQGYLAGALDWGFSLRDRVGQSASWTTFLERGGMSAVNDYPTITFMRTFTNNTSGGQNYQVALYWIGENSNIRLQNAAVSVQGGWK